MTADKNKMLKQCYEVNNSLNSYSGSGYADVCEDDTLSIDCDKKLIRIKHAAYGVFSNDNDCNRKNDEVCVSERSLQVYSLKIIYCFHSDGIK